MPGTSSRTEIITLRIPRELAAALRRRAAKRGVSLATVILTELGAEPPKMGPPSTAERRPEASR